MAPDTNPSVLRIIQISDPHLFAQRGHRLLNVDTDASLSAVVQHIRTHEKSVDILLATGDIAQDGEPAAYERFLQLARPIAPLMLALPGNHDMREPFHGAFGEHAMPITDAGGWRLVLLDSSIADSNAGHLAQDQLDLLQQAATTAGERNVLVAVHHNPVPVGSRWLDTMLIDNGHALLALIETLPQVRGVVWGHVHQAFDSVYSFGHALESSAARRQIRLLATPATSVQFQPLSDGFAVDTIDPGYRWLDLHDNGDIDTGIVRVSGLGLEPDAASKGY